MTSSEVQEFLGKVGEDGDFNQYWYSAYTIQKIVEELLASTSRVACLSTPSIFYSLPKDSDVRKNSMVFDFDEQFAKDPQFVMYDFNKPEELPAHLHHTFDAVVIDPPFITAPVWLKYTEAAKLLLQPGGKVIGTTVIENAALLEEKLGARPTPFKPSIPNLVYQYNTFTNFEPKVLNFSNPEIPDEL